MMITDSSKRVIPFRERDAKRLGEGCFYLDSIVWLNGDRIELGDNVGFNVGCFINGFSGLIVGDGVVIGAGSVVVRDVEDYAVVVGNPAKTIKSRK